MSNLFLRTTLALTGVVVMYLGVNVGFGGIQTLGLQGDADFLQVTDQAAFDVRDNHVRFIGGTLIAMGASLVYSGVALTAARMILPMIAALFVVGGIARLSAADFNLLFSLEIAPSLVFELVGFPLLALWVWRATTTGAELKAPGVQRG